MNPIKITCQTIFLKHEETFMTYQKGKIIYIDNYFYNLKILQRKKHFKILIFK